VHNSQIFAAGANPLQPHGIAGKALFAGDFMLCSGTLKITSRSSCKEWEMMRKVFVPVLLSAVLLFGAVVGHAADWIKNDVDVPNKNMAANYYDSKSVKVRNRTLNWTEKIVLTDFGAKYYTKHLLEFPACKKSIESKGEVTHHEVDLQIRQGKFRTVGKRNFNKNNELMCTDKDMGNEMDKTWHEIQYQSPMYFREYELVTKYKLGNI
jgi:hypothetical protein